MTSTLAMLKWRKLQKLLYQKADDIGTYVSADIIG